MELGIKQKRALVMGASQGLGKGIAEALVKEGVRVAICARNRPSLETTQKEIGAELALVCDLSKKDAAKLLISELKQKWGGIDILVVNTGGPPKGYFEDISNAQWEQGFQSLWLSTVESIREVLPEMKKQKWGRIMVVTSSAAKEPIKGLTVSNGLRAGLLGLIKSVSTEVAPFGITVNAILPGYTDTERLRELGISKETIVSHIPAGRLGTVRELGSLAAFIASDLAGFITGQPLVADGGSNRGI